MKYSFNYSDNNYASAINYDGTNYYNAPVTIEINGKKFILSVGSSDEIKIKKHGKEFIFIVGENSRLDYISLTRIYLPENLIESAYLSGNDINEPDSFSYGIMNKSLTKQINILSEYL